MINRRSTSRRRFLKYSALGVAGIAGLGSGLTNLLNTGMALAVNPTAYENSLLGSSGWMLNKTADDTTRQIKGYASATSVNKGASINFHVSVNTPQTYSIQIFRMGWYNGTGGRLMQTVSALSGTTQAVPAPDAVGMVACTWSVAYTLNVPTSWTSGVYLAKLTNAAGFDNHIHFVVRDDARSADLMFQCSVTTYNAYNTFGGRSLYPEDSVGGIAARKVSFDRPYFNEGMGHFYDWEMPILRFIEKNGYDVVYATNVDLHTTPTLMSNRKGFLSVGHDEYYSKEMYDNLIAFRDSGKHLAFLSANNVYWQIRFESNAAGVPNRVVTCYKSNYPEDPMYPGPYTTYLWRENPDPAYSRPENQLVGVMWDSYKDTNTGQPYIVQNSNHWIYAGTGFVNGTSVAGLVGYEWDKRFANGMEPAGLISLSASPVRNQFGTRSTANSTIYQAASGAWVFAAGSIYWSYGLDYLNFWQVKNLTNAGIQRTTRNLLDRFISSGGGTPLPSVSSLSPTSASQNGAAFTLTVNGANFVSGAVVKWNGSTRTTSFVSSSQLTAQVNAADLTAAGTFNVTVTNPDNSVSNTAIFTVVAPATPAISSLSPSSASKGGAAFTLTVNGSNFVSGATVKWNGSARTTTFVSAAQLTAQITAADLATAGTFAITVTNPSGTTSNAVNFTVAATGAPFISTLAPTHVQRDWSDFTLKVNGTNFVTGAVIKWNGSARTTTFVNSTQVKCLIENVDSLVVGNFPVTVTNPGGAVSNAVNFVIDPE